MKNVSLSKAKANIDDVLRTVECGEAVTIQPDPPLAGEAEAELVARTNRAIQGIKDLRKQTKPVTVEEIIAWKNEGRD
jgi:antitoxin (DNA-binding transcriptional repressor) of toxin-antitoxin stability system